MTHETTEVKRQTVNGWGAASAVLAFVVAAGTLLGLLLTDLLFSTYGLLLVILAPLSVVLGILSLVPRFRRGQGRALGILGIVIGGLATATVWSLTLIPFVLTELFTHLSGQMGR